MAEAAKTDPTAKTATAAKTDGGASFVSTTFDRSMVGTYRLTFSISEDGLDYGIWNDNRELLLLKSYANERNLPRNEFLDQVAFSDEILKETFKSTDIISQTRRWLLVPNEHYTDGCEPQFLETLHAIERNEDHFAHDALKTLNLNVVFAISQQLYKRCEFYFKHFTFHHVTTPLLLESQRVHTALGQRASMHLAMFEHSFYCIVFGDNGLLLCNEFQTAHAEDVLFYTLSIAQNLTLNLDDTALYFTGRGALKKKTQPLLAEYFKHVVDPDLHFQRQPGLNKMGYHHHQFVHLLFRNV
jgi:hypothetical protein